MLGKFPAGQKVVNLAVCAFVRKFGLLEFCVGYVLIIRIADATQLLPSTVPLSESIHSQGTRIHSLSRSHFCTEVTLTINMSFVCACWPCSADLCRNYWWHTLLLLLLARIPEWQTLDVSGLYPSMHFWAKLDSTKAPPAACFPSPPEFIILHPFTTHFCVPVQWVSANPMTSHLKQLSSRTSKSVPWTVFSVLTLQVPIVVTLFVVMSLCFHGPNTLLIKSDIYTRIW